MDDLRHEVASATQAIARRVTHPLQPLTAAEIRTVIGIIRVKYSGPVFFRNDRIAGTGEVRAGAMASGPRHPTRRSRQHLPRRGDRGVAADRFDRRSLDPDGTFRCRRARDDPGPSSSWRSSKRW